MAGIYRRIGGAWVLLGAGSIPTDTTPPTVPANLRVVGTPTASGFTMSHDASTDSQSGVARYEWQLGATAGWVSNALNLTRSYTGLTANTTYTVSVRAVDNAGNVSGARQLSVTTANIPNPPPTGSPLMGVSNSPETHGGITRWNSVRVYQFSQVSGAIDASTQVVCLSDENGVPIAGGQSSADLLDTKLTALFQAHPNLEVHWANGNEVDADTPNMTQYGATMAAMRQVIDHHVSLGHRCSLWIDLTASHVRNPDGSTNLEPQWRAVAAQYVHGIAGSYYPPGRMQTPPVFTPYSAYLDEFFDVADNWGITKMACWEFGIPPNPSDGTQRPRYVNGFVRYLLSQAATRGKQIVTLNYWDKQKSGGPDNRFAADPAGLNPTTAQAWHDWQNYYG